MERKRVVHVLSTLRRPFAVLLGLLLILDAITTYMGMTTSGFVELNPVILILSEHIGVFWTVFLTKSAALLALGSHELLVSRREEDVPLLANVMAHIVFVPAIVMYLFVVQNNIHILFG